MKKWKKKIKHGEWRRCSGRTSGRIIPPTRTGKPRAAPSRSAVGSHSLPNSQLSIPSPYSPRHSRRCSCWKGDGRIDAVCEARARVADAAKPRGEGGVGCWPGTSHVRNRGPTQSTQSGRKENKKSCSLPHCLSPVCGLLIAARNFACARWVRPR